MSQLNGNQKPIQSNTSIAQNNIAETKLKTDEITTLKKNYGSMQVQEFDSPKMLTT